jgi:hypothetical protein
LVGKRKVLAIEVDDDIGGIVEVNSGVTGGGREKGGEAAGIAADIEDRTGEQGRVLKNDVMRLGRAVGVPECGGVAECGRIHAIGIGSTG